MQVTAISIFARTSPFRRRVRGSGCRSRFNRLTATRISPSKPPRAYIAVTSPSSVGYGQAQAQPPGRPTMTNPPRLRINKHGVAVPIGLPSRPERAHAPTASAPAISCPSTGNGLLASAAASPSQRRASVSTAGRCDRRGQPHRGMWIAQQVRPAAAAAPQPPSAHRKPSASSTAVRCAPSVTSPAGAHQPRPERRDDLMVPVPHGTARHTAAPPRPGPSPSPTFCSPVASSIAACIFTRA